VGIVDCSEIPPENLIEIGITNLTILLACDRRLKFNLAIVGGEPVQS